MTVVEVVSGLDDNWVTDSLAPVVAVGDGVVDGVLSVVLSFSVVVVVDGVDVVVSLVVVGMRLPSTSSATLSSVGVF